MRHILVLIAMVVGGLCSSPIQAETGAERVQSSLDAMRRWIGNGDNGQRWQQFLKSDTLQTEVAKGNAADLGTVRQIYDVYSGDTAGLEHGQFVAVRNSLGRWLDELNAAPQSKNLAEAVRAAKGTARPITADDVATAKRELLADVRALERHINQRPDDQAADWKTILHWETLQAELAKDGAPELEVLNRTLVALKDDREGWEAQSFTDVRASLLNFMNLTLFSSTPGFNEAFDGKIDELAGLLEKYSAAPTSADGIAIGRTLGWFERTRQIATLVGAVQQQHSHPNAKFEVSQRLVAAGIADEVSDTQGVRDCILGTSIRGTAWTNGNTDARLVPNADQASFDILLDAVANSRNVGHNGPVTIHSTGRTNLHAWKRVFLDADGFTSNRAAANASTSSHISNIAARSGLVRKIAWKQAAKKKGQAERIASSHAAGRAAGRVDSQAANFLADANASFNEKIRFPLIRRDGFPRLFNFSSSESNLYVTLLHAARAQMAAPGEAPALTGEHDLSVRLHESAVNNFAESLFGGTTLTNDKLVEILEKADAEVPAELRTTDEEPPWSITFATELPITAEFSEGTIKLAIRGRRFVRGDSEISDPLQISAVYTLEKTDTGSKLTRQGDVSVEYIGRDRLTAEQVTMKTIMQKKFRALFKEEMASEGLMLPGRWERAGKLKLQELAATGSWLTLGWLMPPDASSVASDTPVPDAQLAQAETAEVESVEAE